MGYIRIKRVKEHNYAYIVESKWGKRGPRQKVKKYVGRVYNFAEERFESFLEYMGKNMEVYVHSTDDKEIINDLVGYELWRRGFVLEKSKWVKDSVVVDVLRRKVSTGNNNICLPMNEGFLCKHTLNSLLRMQVVGEGPHEKGYNLAGLFVSAGLNIPQEVFVELCKKKRII